MKNLTLSIDERTLEAAREYATRKGTTVNRMVRDYLTRTVQVGDDDSWVDDLFAELDSRKSKEGKAHSWNREEVYRDRVAWPRKGDR